MIRIGHMVVMDSLSESVLDNVRKELKKCSKERLIEMLLTSSIELEDMHTRAENFRQEVMQHKKSIGGVVV